MTRALRGHHRILGDRADVRSVLYMAALAAIRWQPEFRAFYLQPRARGKVAKVAIVACTRKLPIALNARLRDEYRSEPATANGQVGGRQDSR
jgi:transposase